MKGQVLKEGCGKALKGKKIDRYNNLIYPYNIKQMRKIVLLFIFSSFHLWSQSPLGKAFELKHVNVLDIEFATPIDNENVYEYIAHKIEFSPLHIQARWVGYYISKERLEAKKVKRKGFSFMEDKRIKGGSAKDSDYKKSGYDRGHLAPSRDMAFSKETLFESFLFSNISPQVPQFNRGKWLELEKFARNIAIKHNLVYVVTGPIFKKNIKKIGKSKIDVPSHFFKALLFYNEEKIEAIGFIMPNEKLQEELHFFACSIDYLEKEAEIDVFPSLPDEIEEKIEKDYNSDFWFSNSKENNIAESEMGEE